MIGRTGRLVAALLAGAPALLAQSAPDALARAAVTYDSVRTLRATFVQTVTNPMIGGPEATLGTLYLVRPDRFAMRFTDPAGDRVVVDGRWLWLYLPSSVEGQAIRAPIPEGGSAGPNLFDQFVERPAERYAVEHRGTETIGGQEHDVLRLVPREAALPFRSAVIVVGRRDGLIRRLELAETSGLQRTLALSDIATNVAVPPEEVSFSVPAGVRVVSQQ